jgi:hypothetical protein
MVPSKVHVDPLVFTTALALCHTTEFLRDVAHFAILAPDNKVIVLYGEVPVVKARICFITPLVFNMAQDDITSSLAYLHHLFDGLYRIITMIQGIMRTHKIKGTRWKCSRQFLRFSINSSNRWGEPMLF